ncbi:MAG: hypothetical protein CVV63_03645, partial [Tenericutes bacterium HGW-Tenericutes-8]
GWFKETTLATEWQFDVDVVNQDITLYAGWLMDGPTDQEKVQSVHDWLTLGDIDALTNQSARLILATSRDGASITWSIDKPDYIQANGLIVQPEAETGDQTVTLVATITLGSAALTKTFVATVLALPDITEAPNLIEEGFDYVNGNILSATTPWAPVSGKTGSSLYTVVDSIPLATLPTGSKALKVEALTETQLETAIPHSYDVIVVEMSVLQSTASNGSAIHMQSSASSPVIGFGLDGTSLYYRVDNVQYKVQTVDINTWYQLRLEVDFIHKTIEMFYYSPEGQLIQVTPGKVAFTGTTSMQSLFLRTGSSTTAELRSPAYVTNIVANRVESMPRPEVIVKIGEITGIDATVSIEEGQAFVPQVPTVKNMFGEQVTLVLDTDYSLTITNPVNTAVAGDYVVTYTFTNAADSSDIVVVTQDVNVYSVAQPNEITNVTTTLIPYLGETTDVTVTLLQPNGKLFYLLSNNETETVTAIKAGSFMDITNVSTVLEDLVVTNETYLHMVVELNGDSNLMHHALTFESITELSTAEAFYQMTTSTSDTSTYVLIADIDFA